MAPIQNEERAKGKEVLRISPNQHKGSSGKDSRILASHLARCCEKEAGRMERAVMQARKA